MKVFNIFICVALILVASTTARKDPRKHAKCLADNELSNKEFLGMWKAAKKGSTDIDNRMKCYTHCMLESSGHLDENGKLNMSSMGKGKKMTEEGLKIAEDCKNRFEGIDEKCDYSYQVSYCIAEEKAKKGLLKGKAKHDKE
ncbi:general odorant-binding protein 57c-like [Musca vetustissima]|uniref:general odorant-binding protein 57c-like n=1 Tax=Musca vetustissima TaxID=27455 RepID=UPI002AB7D7C2|nr:general odorant-binding protein 57c-like [Musca vetustissima]